MLFIQAHALLRPVVLIYLVHAFSSFDAGASTNSDGGSLSAEDTKRIRQLLDDIITVYWPRVMETKLVSTEPKQLLIGAIDHTT